MAVFCKHHLNPVRVCLNENLSTVEAVCIDFNIATCIRMLCVYRPRNCTNLYNECMFDVITHCDRYSNNIVMLGDFNFPLVHWSNNSFPRTQPYYYCLLTQLFQYAITENALTQHVNVPTQR